jgi:hypothetical protein
LTPGYFCIKATQHSTKDLCFMYSSYMNILCSSVYLILNTEAKNKHSTWFPINYKTITLRIWTLSLKQNASHHSDMTLRCRQCMRHSTIHRFIYDPQSYQRRHHRLCCDDESHSILYTASIRIGELTASV